MKLTIKQQKFIDAYIETGNATEAAKRAGYSDKYASTNTAKLLKNTIILQAIEKRRSEIKSAKTADLIEVMEFLTSVMRGEVDEDTINPVSGQHDRLEASVKNRIDAAKEIIKRYPTKLLDEEQRLKLEKLRAEVENLRASTKFMSVEIVDDLDA